MEPTKPKLTSKHEAQFCQKLYLLHVKSVLLVSSMSCGLHEKLTKKIKQDPAGYRFERT